MWFSGLWFSLVYFSLSLLAYRAALKRNTPVSEKLSDFYGYLRWDLMMFLLSLYSKNPYLLTATTVQMFIESCYILAFKEIMIERELDQCLSYQ